MSGNGDRFALPGSEAATDDEPSFGLQDNRGVQESLDIGLGAGATEDREGTTVTSSTSFLDDRDPNRGEATGDSSEQGNLFTETETLDDQQSLTGGMATVESTGLLDDPAADSGQPAGLSVGSDTTTAGSARQPTKVDVGSQAAANEIRDEFGEHLADSDDGRETTVRLTPSAPGSVVNQAQLMQEEMQAAQSRSQTTSLTEKEREKIKQASGFSQSTTTANWRSAKGVLAREGLTDQFRDAIGSIADYEDPIEGAEAWVERHKASGIGNAGRMNVGESDIQQQQRAGQAAAAEQQNLESHLRQGAKQGNEEAIDALVHEAGYSRQEAEALAGRVEDPQDNMTQAEFEQIVVIEVKRARANGRFVKEEPQQTGLGSFRSPSNGRFVGDTFSDPEIGRNTETGRYVDLDGDR